MNVGHQQQVPGNLMNEDQLPQGSDNLNIGPAQLPEQQVQVVPDEQNIAVGMALMPSLRNDQAYRVWQENRATEAAKLWDNFLSKGNDVSFIAKIPTNWAFFFTSMLLSPHNFDWATEFLSSPAAAHISNSQGNISLPIPKQCPVNKKVCSQNIDNNGDTLTEAGSSLGKDNAGKNKGVIIQEIEENGEKGTPYKKKEEPQGI